MLLVTIYLWNYFNLLAKKNRSQQFTDVGPSCIFSVLSVPLW